MFFRKDNIVEVDFFEYGKPSKKGKIMEFSEAGVVFIFDGDDKPTFVPMVAVSEIRLIEGSTNSIPRTQF